jgi:hypothetical protein
MTICSDDGGAADAIEMMNSLILKAKAACFSA